MNNTFSVFDDRKKEINLYFKTLKLIDKHIYDDTNNSIYSIEFFKMLKSSFILLLYNLIEAAISSGITDIYEKIKSGKYKYDAIIPEIRKIWINTKMKDKNTAINKIIDSIITDIIELDRKNLTISGNLDDDKIREICKEHKICFNKVNGAYLKEIKDKRNSLAHGIDSFTDCARELTVQDLEIIKDNVLEFIESILNDMKRYHDNKLFLIKKITL